MSEPTGVHAMPEWARKPIPARCPDCHTVPKPVERHSLLDGTTPDGEPLGFTCLNEHDQVIYLPDPSTRYSVPDPWSSAPLPQHQQGCPELFAVDPTRDTCTCPRPRADEPPF